MLLLPSDAVSLEEVLAAARDRPDNEAENVVDADEEEDSEETSSSEDADESSTHPQSEPIIANLLDTIRGLEEKEALEENSDEDSEDGFAFVKADQAEEVGTLFLIFVLFV